MGKVKQAIQEVQQEVMEIYWYVQGNKTYYSYLMYKLYYLKNIYER